MDRNRSILMAAATYAGAETLDNVRAPDGATCRLVATRVQGTIEI